MVRGPANEAAAETVPGRGPGEERKRTHGILEWRANVKRANVWIETGTVSEDQMTQGVESHMEEFGVDPKAKGFKQGDEVRCELKGNDFCTSNNNKPRLTPRNNPGAMAVTWKDASGKCV